MIPGVIAAAGSGGIPAAAVPTFIGAGTWLEDGGVTEIDVEYPSDLEAGDLILMQITSRSALTTPAGWTLVVDQDVSDLEFGQHMTIFSITATGSETGTLTVVQAVAGNRFLGQMINIRSSLGTPTITVDTQGDNGATGAAISTGSVTAVVDDTLAVVSLSTTFAASSGGNTQLNPEATFENINPGNVPEKRQSWGYLLIDTGLFDSNVVWQSNISGGDRAWVNLLVVNP